MEKLVTNMVDKLDMADEVLSLTAAVLLSISILYPEIRNFGYKESQFPVAQVKPLDVKQLPHKEIFQPIQDTNNNLFRIVLGGKNKKVDS